MMRNLLFLFLIITLFSACSSGSNQSSGNSTEETEENTETMQDKNPNTLTEEEANAGWMLLFDGSFCFGSCIVKGLFFKES